MSYIISLVFRLTLLLAVSHVWDYALIEMEKDKKGGKVEVM